MSDIEKRNSVEKSIESGPSNLAEENERLEEEVDTCNGITRTGTENIQKKYRNIDIPNVSNDAQKELDNRTKEAKEEYAEAKKNLENPVVKFMDGLTQEKEETEENSANLNVAANNTKLKLGQRFDGILAGNTESHRESIDPVA